MTVIPASVRYDMKLKPNEKLLFGEIVDTCNARGFSDASNKELASRIGVDQGTITMYLKSLIDQNHIHREILYQSDKNFKLRKLFPLCISPELLAMVKGTDTPPVMQERSVEACMSLIDEGSTMEKQLWQSRARDKNLILEDEKRKFINFKLENENYIPTRSTMIRGFDSWIIRAYPNKAKADGKSNRRKSTRERIAGQ